jgi:hypothetical protein
MAAAKIRAESAGADDACFLYRIARFEEANADDAFAKTTTSAPGPCTCFWSACTPPPCVAGRVQRRGVLRDIVKTLKAENRTIPAEKIDAWLASSAGKSKPRPKPSPLRTTWKTPAAHLPGGLPPPENQGLG